MNDQTINAAGLAVLFGVSDRVIREHTASGMLVKTGESYALIPNVPTYCAHLRKLAMMRGGGEAAIATATVERGRLAKAQADHVETKNAKARGDLVAATDVEAEWTGIMRTVRAGMLAVPSRVSQRLPHLTAHDVSEIDREVREVLTAMGNATS
jgi:phage terminase Nu1 subunit (DNA packaging protein)